MKADNLLNWEKRELAELLADKYADESLLIEAFPSIAKASCLENSWIPGYIEKNWQEILYDYDIAELGEWIDDVDLMERLDALEDEIRSYNLIAKEEFVHFEEDENRYQYSRDINEIYNHIERCKPFIVNCELIEGLDLNYTRVDIDRFQIDKREDRNLYNWEYSLYTTMYTKTDKNGRDVYSVRWQFKDGFEHVANFTMTGYGTSGSLLIDRFSVGDTFGIFFCILPNYRTRFLKIDETSGAMTQSWEYDDPFFKFDNLDLITILSVEWKGHQTFEEALESDEDLYAWSTEF